MVFAQMNVLRSGLMLSLVLQKNLSLKIFQETGEVLRLLDLMESLVRGGLHA